MGRIEDLIRWAKANGITLRGIQARKIPGRGTGVVAIQKLRAGEKVIFVPYSLVRNLDSIPQSVSDRLPKDMAIHGQLAVELALDKSEAWARWDAVMPSQEDLETSMPFTWHHHLQDLLPQPTKDLLAKQKAKFSRAWVAASTSIPELSLDRFRRAWLLLNSRSFLHENARSRAYPWEDRLAIMPVADLFNHTNFGCSVSFDEEGYSFVTEKEYRAGEEVYISYGRHSNDYLWAEYGFFTNDNRWDHVSLDDVILPRLSDQQKDQLAARNLLGGYPLDVGNDDFNRTEVVLRVLCCSEDQWQKFADAPPMAQTPTMEVDNAYMELVDNLVQFAKERVKAAQETQVGLEFQRKTIIDRWEQIASSASRVLQPEGQ